MRRKLDDAGKKVLVEQAIKRVQERVKDIAKQGEKLGAATNVTTILKAHMIFGANDRLRLLRSLLEADANHAQSVDTIKAYMEKVVPERNVLGHMVLAPEGRPQAVVNIEGTQINLDDMRTLRKTILGLREDFRALVGARRLDCPARAGGAFVASAIKATSIPPIARATNGGTALATCVKRGTSFLRR